MRMLPMQPGGQLASRASLPLFAMLIIVLAMGLPGCKGRTTPEADLVESLDGDPLIIVEGCVSAGFAEEAILTHIQAIRADGVDLFKAYQLSRGRENARISLAYMLVLDEDDDYMALVESVRPESIPDKEFQVWAVVLMDEKQWIGPHYRRRMIDILEGVDLPRAEIVVGEHRIAVGDVDKGIAGLLHVCYPIDAWSSAAYNAINKAPELPRKEALKPYLANDDVRAVAAAYALLYVAECHSLAMDRLEELARSNAPEVSEYAVIVLRWAADIPGAAGAK